MTPDGDGVRPGPDLDPDLDLDGVGPAGLVLGKLLSGEASGAGQGHTWAARLAGRDCVLRLGPGALAEVAVGLRVRHASLPVPFAWGRAADGRPWCTREWIEGQPFDRAWAEVPAERVATWVQPLLGALAALHDAGYVHRDVKSDNVLVCRGDAGPDVGSDRVALMDLDLAARGGPSLGVAGSVHHLAPELLQGGRPSPASDLFALGAMLALAACGTPAPDFHERFPGASFWEASGLDPRRLPQALATLTRALVSRDVSARPADVTAALALLDADVPATGGGFGLPFLAGREEPLARLADRVAPQGMALVVTVADPREVLPLQSALALELMLRDVEAGRDGDGGPPPAVCVAACEDGRHEQRERCDELLGALLLTPLPPPRALVVVAGPESGAALSRAWPRVLLDDERGRLDAMAWPTVTSAAVEQHLRQLSGDGAPATCRSLARSLVEATEGHWSRLERALEHAVASGVMAPDGSLLLDHWPAEAGAEHAADAGDDQEPHVDEHGEQQVEPQVEQRLQAADAARRQGAAAAARRMCLALRRARPSPSAEQLARVQAIEFRLDLSQGLARDVLQRLRDAHGHALSSAPLALMVVGALAAEQLGDRELARELAARLAARRTAPEAAFGRMGLAHAKLLDGETAEALALATATPSADAEDAAGDPEALVALSNIAGLACMRLGRADQAAAHYEAAREAAVEAGDLAGEARSELNRAALERGRGQGAEAGRRLQRAVELFDRSGHVGGRALALNNLGVLQRDHGELSTARDLLGRAGALRRRVGDALGAAGSLGSLAFVMLDAGEVGPAAAVLDRADAMLAAGGYAEEQSLVALQRAAAWALAGRQAEAAAVLAAPATEAARRRQPALTARLSALVSAVAGEVAEARRHLTAAWAASESDPGHPERVRAAAWWLVLEPEHAEARELLAQVARHASHGALRAEAAWRLTRRDDEHDPDELSAWCAEFERAGRTDLVRATSLCLMRVARGRRDAGLRRAAASRAARAAEAMLAGLALPQRAPTARTHDPQETSMDAAGSSSQAIVNRITALAGGPVAAAADSAVELDWYLACNRRMAAENDLEGLLGTIVDAALELVGARRGLLMLMDDQDLEVEVARAPGQRPMPADEAQFSRTLVRRALDEGAPLVITDASRDERFQSSRSISSLALRSVLCVPFEAAEGLRGALYLDDEAEAGVFDGSDLAGVRALADQAAIAINNLRRREQIEGLNRRLAERVEFQSEELRQARSEWRQRGAVAPVGGLVGESECMRAVYRQVERFAPTDLPVLVTGPSGTGKDLVARALHEHSARASGPLIIENVAALPAQLLESEMFGHVRGAFTGADRDRPGLFAEADGGTFVLDEIGEMPAELQAKLLRVLESGEFRPVGSRRTRKVDVRIVAVTNRDLAARVASGDFREDLFYRLNAAEIHMPALATRLDDLPLLVRHFVGQLDERHGSTKPVDDEVLAAFTRRAWPGNVRELANEVARVYVLSGDRLDDPTLVRAPAMPGSKSSSSEPMPESLKLEDVERAALERALRAAGGRKDRAAGLLGISRAGLYAKLKRLGLDGDRGDD